MTDKRIILSTAGSQEEARMIARDLVDMQLAACVNIVPGVESVYRWEGKVETAGEWLLLIKTTTAAFPRVRDAITELHSYKVPECVVLAIEDGGASYLEWSQIRSRHPRKQEWRQASLPPLYLVKKFLQALPVMPDVALVVPDIFPVVASIGAVVVQVLTIVVNVTLVVIAIRAVVIQVAFVVVDVALFFSGVGIVLVAEIRIAFSAVFVDVGAVMIDIALIAIAVRTVVVKITLIVPNILAIVPQIAAVMPQVFAVALGIAVRGIRLGKCAQRSQGNKHQGQKTASHISLLCIEGLGLSSSYGRLKPWVWRKVSQRNLDYGSYPRTWPCTDPLCLPPQRGLPCPLVKPCHRTLRSRPS